MITKTDATDMLISDPQKLVELFGITRADALKALDEKLCLGLTQELGGGLAEVMTIPMSQAKQLTGASEHLVRNECSVINYGKRNVRVTYADVVRMIEKHKTPPRKEAVNV